MPWSPPAVPTLVVAPHPDDEVLMAGGLIAIQRRRGVDVDVVAVTDGEAAYPGAVLPDVLGPVRVCEQEAALGVLGVQADHIHRVGVPDGGVPDAVERLISAVAELRQEGGLVVLPWSGDHHSDHVACSAVGRHVPNAVYGFFWAWHRTPMTLFDDVDLLGISLPDDILAQKSRALAQHRSQFRPTTGTPILDQRLVEPVMTPVEYLIGEPRDL